MFIGYKYAEEFRKELAKEEPTKVGELIRELGNIGSIGNTEFTLIKNRYVKIAPQCERLLKLFISMLKLSNKK